MVEGLSNESVLSCSSNDLDFLHGSSRTSDKRFHLRRDRPTQALIAKHWRRALTLPSAHLCRLVSSFQYTMDSYPESSLTRSLLQTMFPAVDHEDGNNMLQHYRNLHGALKTSDS